MCPSTSCVTRDGKPCTTCLVRDRAWFVCDHCGKVEREPAAYRATIGTRDQKFRVFSFCTLDPCAITWMNGF